MFTQNALLAETGKLQKFSMKLTRNKADSDDLFQSTYLRAIEKSHLFEKGTNLFGWTSKIMYNLFVSGYRRRVKHETQYDPEIYTDRLSVRPEQEAHSELAQVRRAMLKLDKNHSQIITLVCVHGMLYEEVSDMLKIPLGTVRSRLSRARGQLKEIMGAAQSRVTVPPVRFSKVLDAITPIIPAYIAAHDLRRIPC